MVFDSQVNWFSDTEPFDVIDILGFFFIDVGTETLSPDSLSSLPRRKDNTADLFIPKPTLFTR